MAVLLPLVRLTVDLIPLILRSNPKRSKRKKKGKNRQSSTQGSEDTGDVGIREYQIPVDGLLPLQELRASSAHLDVYFHGGKTKERGRVSELRAPLPPPLLAMDGGKQIDSMIKITIHCDLFVVDRRVE